MRLATAVASAASGVVIAVLAGQPEAVVLVAPWAMLLVLGLIRFRQSEVEVVVDVESDRLMVGDDVNLRVTVDGLAGSALITATPSTEFWLDGEDDDHETETSVREVMVREHGVFDLSLRALRWGTHDVGFVELEATERYGLFRYKITAGEPRYIRVHPTQTQMRNLLSPWLVRRVTGAHDSTAIGRGVEYADIRLFAQGDSLREINWKATARSEDLWVSQRHPERATDVVMLLDSFVDSGHDVQMVFGLAVEAAVALAESHLAANDKVGLVELGGIVRWVSPGAGSHHLQRLSDFLLATKLQSHSADRDLSVVMTRALPPRSFVVALTPLLDERFVEAVLMIAGRGHDVAVVECEPIVATIERTTDDVVRLATRIWQAERQIVRDRLMERGVAVATWRSGDHLDVVLSTLAGFRRRAVKGRRR